LGKFAVKNCKFAQRIQRIEKVRGSKLLYKQTGNHFLEKGYEYEEMFFCAADNSFDDSKADVF
jgi:hypothetical protein